MGAPIQHRSEHFEPTPENLHLKKIVRRKLFPILTPSGEPFTDGHDKIIYRMSGDDSGYRNIPLVEAAQPLVAVDSARTSCPYDGADIYTGKHDAALCLPGGTGGQIYAREPVVRFIGVANRYLGSRYPGMELLVLDAFRSYERQAAGFTRTLIQILNGVSCPDLKALYFAGLAADYIFSWVNPSFNDPACQAFVKDLLHDSQVKILCRELAESEGVSEGEISLNLAAICANVAVAGKYFKNTPQIPAARGVVLDYKNNAHSGGGAIDMFLVANGKILNLIPFDFVGPEAAVDYPEDDGNYLNFQRAALANKHIKAHLEGIGIDPSNITASHWTLWRESNRILQNLVTRMGGTYYTGENWHVNTGVAIRDPENPKHILIKPELGRDLLFSGNSCQAILCIKDNPQAVWGGVFAHEQLKAKGVLDLLSL